MPNKFPGFIIAVIAVLALAGCHMQVNTAEPIVSLAEDEGFPLGEGPLYAVDPENDIVHMFYYVRREGHWPNRRYVMDSATNTAPLNTKSLGGDRYILTFLDDRDAFHYFVNVVLRIDDDTIYAFVDPRKGKYLDLRKDLAALGYERRSVTTTVTRNGEEKERKVRFYSGFDPDALASDLNAILDGKIADGAAIAKPLMYTKAGLKRYFPDRYKAMEDGIAQIEACLAREEDKRACASE